jgi:hypothetical protein
MRCSRTPKFRAEWERTALARAVAEAVIRYRAEHGLSQTALARVLGWSQPAGCGDECGVPRLVQSI